MSESFRDGGIEPAPHDRGDDQQEVSSASRQIEAAQAGDLDALTPVIESVSPFLLALARTRLGSFSRVEPEDLVQDAWAVAIRRLPDLVARDGHLSAVLFRFLSSTITRRVNDVLRQAVRELQGYPDETAPEVERAAAADAPHAEVFKQAVRAEVCQEVLERLQSLPANERELFLRRALEGLAYPLIARLLNEAPNTLAKRYQRIRDELRQSFDMDLFDEFMD